MSSLPKSVPHVVEVELLRGPRAPADAPPDLLVEVPHGADRRAHYDALQARLKGAMPADLHAFFHVNTDVGAWQLGRRIAERIVEAEPQRQALILRCLVPRTFVDCNRVIGAATGGDLRTSGITSAVPPYVRDDGDLALLFELHRSYVEVAEQAYALVCDAGGLALNPHTYGPRTLAVDRVDDDIVPALYRAHEPEAYARAPVRPEVDLICRTEDGTSYAPEGMAAAVSVALGALGVEVAEQKTYFLHPATQGTRFSLRWPGRVFCFEVRRDLLVEAWTPFEEQQVDAAKVERLAGPLAEASRRWLP